MKRIIIIGSSGAGKTTLARKLSEKLSIPHTEMDSIIHQANWSRLDDKEFSKRVHKIADGPEWILCGNYFSKPGMGLELWQKADTVVWCDYPFHVVASRLLRRTLKRTVTREILWNGNRERFYTNFFTKDSLFIWMISQWNKQQTRYSALFNNKTVLSDTALIHLRNAKQTRAFLRSMELTS